MEEQNKFIGEPALKILSLGAGVQSSTMALMADTGEFGIQEPLDLNKLFIFWAHIINITFH